MVMSRDLSTTIAIRPARAADAVGIARVHVSTWRDTYRGLLPDPVLDGLTVPGKTASWNHALRRKRKDHPTFVAVANNRIVGFASGGPRRGRVLAHDGEVYTLYLMQNWQGYGAGRRLMQAVARALHEQGTGSLCVWVLVSNDDARDFYEHIGGDMCAAQPFEMGGRVDAEVAYGWPDIAALL